MLGTQILIGLSFGMFFSLPRKWICIEWTARTSLGWPCATEPTMKTILAFISARWDGTAFSVTRAFLTAAVGEILCSCLPIICHVPSKVTCNVTLNSFPAIKLCISPCSPCWCMHFLEQMLSVPKTWNMKLTQFLYQPCRFRFFFSMNKKKNFELFT